MSINWILGLKPEQHKPQFLGEDWPITCMWLTWLIVLQCNGIRKRYLTSLPHQTRMKILAIPLSKTTSWDTLHFFGSLQIGYHSWSWTDRQWCHERYGLLETNSILKRSNNILKLIWMGQSVSWRRIKD